MACAGSRARTQRPLSSLAPASPWLRPTGRKPAKPPAAHLVLSCQNPAELRGGARWGVARRLSGNAGSQPPVLRFGQACGLGFHTDVGDSLPHSVMPTVSSIPVLVPEPMNILQGRCQPHGWLSHGSEAPLPTPRSWGVCKGLPWKSHPPQTQLQRWAGQETLAKSAGDQTSEPVASTPARLLRWDLLPARPPVSGAGCSG